MNNTQQTTMQKAIEARLAIRKTQKEAETLSLLENDAFMDVQTGILALSKEVKSLDSTLHQLNTGITPFIAKDGSKYSVRVFPVNAFGIGLDKLIGIIANSGSAFTDEMALQYETIVGVPFIELQLANVELGSVAYVNKEGLYVEGSRSATKADLPDKGTEHLKAVKEWEHTNVEKLHAMLNSICIKLELYEILPDKSKLLNSLHAWERTAIRRAKKQEEEIAKSTTLNEASEFTID